MSQPEPVTNRTTLRRSLRFSDLLLYGIILIQPTAPMPSFGVIYAEAHGHVVTCILLAMVAMLFTSISYGRMARVYPQGGSAFLYVGRELHEGLGYITGWCLILDYVLNPLICTIWCSRAAINFLPQVPYPVYAVCFAVLFTALNCRGVETSARINRALAAALGCVLVLIVAAALRWILHLSHPTSALFLEPFYNPATFRTDGLLRGTSIAVLTYIGFDGISTLTDEAEQPARNIPRAIVMTCLITGILASVEVYLAQVVWPQGAPFPDVDTAYVHVAQRMGGPLLFLIVNGTLLVATVGSGMASQLGAARLLYAMGQDGALPAAFAKLAPATQVPRNNVLLVGAISLAGALLFSYQLGTELLNYGALLAFMGVNVASVVHAVRHGEERRWVPIALSFAGFATCLFLWIHLGRIALLAGTVWAVLGAGLWWLRRSSMHLKHEPIEPGATR